MLSRKNAIAKRRQTKGEMIKRVNGEETMRAATGRIMARIPTSTTVPVLSEYFMSLQKAFGKKQIAR